MYDHPARMISNSPTLNTRPHYQVLDGLRGVAALMVVVFHLFEVYSDENRFRQIINHGYLAVDFFFLLSGFVVAYAYDDRWSSMSLWQFAKRRLIRLQPMVVFGAVLGACLYYFQRCTTFPLIAVTPVWRLLLVTLAGCLMLPLTAAFDIRGWNETYPLNGAAWSLLFEYIANFLYAAGVRKFSNKALAVLVSCSAAFLIQLLVFGSHGDVIGGWSVEESQLHIGFARLLFPFFAGMLLMRLHKQIHVRHSFLLCTVLLITAMALPRFGGPQHLWVNGLYESAVIILLFPLIIAMGAGAGPLTPATERACRWLGEISYPLYITHYTLINVYIAWVARTHAPPAKGAQVGVALFLTALAIAYTALKLYDEPVRRWLTRRLLPRP